jgi:hypothetical protein
MQHTDRPLNEVTLLLIAQTKISLTKCGFHHPSELNDRNDIPLLLKGKK